MHLTSGILDQAGIKREQVADVAGGGVRHIDDLRQIHRELIGGLFGIDAWNRGRDTDLLQHHLFVIQHNPNVSNQRIGLI